MPVETEAKIRLANPDATRCIIEQHFGASRCSIIQRDMFYDTPDHRLRDAGCGLRLRSEQYTGDPSHSRDVITYKGSLMHTAIKQREEIEFDVGNRTAAALLLQRLGFEPQLDIEKHRQRWKLDQLNIELDEVRQLGWFLEVEGPDEASVMNICRTLGLGDEPLILTSYVQMLAEQQSGD